VVEVEEVDLDELVATELDALVAFERTLWAEEEPGEPALAVRVVAWMNRLRPGTSRAAWVVRGAGGAIDGLAVLRLPLTDNVHLGVVHDRVVPSARRRGVGRSLLAAVAERASSEGRTVLQGFTWDTVPSGEPFARRAGAAPGLLVRRSELDLVALDRTRVGAWLDGVRSATRRAYDLVFVDGRYPADQYGAIAEVETVMNTQPHDDLDVEDEVRDEAWVAAAEAAFDPVVEQRWTLFARSIESGRFVGFTQVFFYDDWPGMVNQGNTGVHPDHRGHGLGLWLKAAMLERIFAERPGSRRMRTSNAWSNAPMLAINDELGYRVTATQTAWQVPVATVVAATSS
jgi:GNAT superfamily N-acetyltransferase